MQGGYLCWRFAVLSHNASIKRKQLISEEKTSSVRSEAGQAVYREGTQLVFERTDLFPKPFLLILNIIIQMNSKYFFLQKTSLCNNFNLGTSLIWQRITFKDLLGLCDLSCMIHLEILYFEYREALRRYIKSQTIKVNLVCRGKQPCLKLMINRGIDKVMNQSKI